MSNYIYSMSQVLNILAQDYGYTQFNTALKGTEIRCRCPKCGGKKIEKNFGVNLDNEIYNCFSCGFSGRFSTNLYAELLGIDRAEANKEIMGRLGITKDQAYPRRQRKAPEVRDSVEAETVYEAPIEMKDKVNRCMLRTLSLSERHLKDMLDRGLTEREVSELGYKTLPGDDIKTVWKIEDAIKENKLSPEGVAGHYLTPKKAQWILNYPKKDVILVKYMTMDNKLAAFQERKNNEDLRPGEEKYCWLTSNGKNHGSKPSQMVHYAVDFEKDEDGNYRPKLFEGQSGKKYMCITEGAMKADIAHMISGKPFIALPGVGILKGLEKDLPRLKELGVSDFIICYDTDQIMNINVLKNLEKLEKMLYDAGFKVQNGTIWDLVYEKVDGKKAKFSLDSDFVFTRKTLKKAIEDETLDSVLEDVMKLGRNSLYFAIPDVFSKEDRDLYSTLLNKAKTAKFKSCRYVRYKITYKGVDDFYAGQKRNVVYV